MFCQTVRMGILLFGSALLTFGCSQSPTAREGSAVPTTPKSQRDNHDADPALSSARNSRTIYVDSVPSGANVYVKPPDGNMKMDADGFPVAIGKTPFVLDLPERHGAEISIVWEMKDFLVKVESIPAMKDWTARFKAGQEFDQGPLASQNYFLFDTPSTWVILLRGNRIESVGPTYSLDECLGNRLCALFIPRGIKPSVLHSLMPPPTSFDIDVDVWTGDLAKRGLTPEQALEAVECLRRCGKFFVVIPDPADPKSELRITSTAQKTQPVRYVTQTRRHSK